MPSTTSINATTALEEIATIAVRILGATPMNCDMPHVHLGVRALVARAQDVVGGLCDETRNEASARGLRWLIPDASTIASLNPTGELLGELDAIGEAILAVIGYAAQRITVAPLVERMQAIAGALADGVAPDDLQPGEPAITPI